MHVTKSPEEWITVSEAYRRFGLSPTAIYRMVKDGEIASKRPPVGNGMQVNAQEIEERMRKDNDK